MKQRGAAMLYAVMMSVIAAGIVGGVVRMAAITSSEEARAERMLRARAMADLQLANIASWAKDGSLVVGQYYALTMSNVTAGATATALTSPAGLLQVEQTVRVGNTSFLFRDYVAASSPTVSISMIAPTWSGSAEPNGAGFATGSDAIGAPDFIAATLDSLPRLSHTSSVFSQNLNMTPAGSAAIATALGVTVSQLSEYEFIAFQATRSTSNNLNNVTFEFTRGNLSMFRTGAATGDVKRGTMSVSDYASAFGISASAPAAITGISIAAFDLTEMLGGTPNGPALIAASGTWNVTITNVNALTGNTQYAGTSSDIDTILMTGTPESSTPNGLLLELSQYVTNVIDGTTATAPQPTYVRRIESVPGRATVASKKWAGAFPDNTKWATYSGNLIAPVSGTYTFRVLQDNGARVFLNGNYICGLWNEGSGTSTSSGIALVAGQSYPLTIEYMEGGTGNENLDFQWTYPTQAWQTIPLAAVTPGLGSDLLYFNDFETNGLTTPEFTLTNPRNSSHGNGPQGNTVPGANGVGWLPGASSVLGDFGAPWYPTLSQTTQPSTELMLFRSNLRYDANNFDSVLRANGRPAILLYSSTTSLFANAVKRSWQLDWVKSTKLATFRVWSSSDFSGTPLIEKSRNPVMNSPKVFSGLSIAAQTYTNRSVLIEGVEYDSGNGFVSLPSANGLLTGNTLTSKYYKFDGYSHNFSLRGVTSMADEEFDRFENMNFIVTGIQSDLTLPGAKLNLGTVPAGRIILYFEPIILQTWDGNTSNGPDRFRLKVNGVNHFDFSPMESPQPLILNGPISTQFYSSNGPVFAHFTTIRSGVRQYSVRTEFDHPGGNLTIDFEGYGEEKLGQPSGFQGINDESWALDNIAIRRVR
jgi:hypothetical protein